MSAFNCQIAPPSNQEPLTVGAVFHLNCLADTDFPPETTWKMDLPPEQKYILQILKQNHEGRKWAFDVVSYKTGEHQLEKLQFRSQQDEVVLSGPVMLTIASVLDAKNQQQEPYGPMGPIPVAIPAEWLIGIFLSLLFVVVVLWAGARKKWRQRQFIASLQKRSVSGELLPEMQKRLRHAQNKIQDGLFSFKLIEDIWRDYFELKLRIPLSRAMTSRSLEAAFKGLSGYQEKWAQQVLMLHQEIQNCAKVQNLSPADLAQLIQSIRVMFERLEGVQRKEAQP